MKRWCYLVCGCVVNAQGCVGEPPPLPLPSAPVGTSSSSSSSSGSGELGVSTSVEESTSTVEDSAADSSSGSSGEIGLGSESSSGGPMLAIAGELVVSLDAEHPSAGASLWSNQGTGSDFELYGISEVVTIGGHFGVVMDGELLYASSGTTHPSLVGVDPTRTVEVWVYNDAVVHEESMVAWGYRGGVGTNMSFGFGFNLDRGAVSHGGEPLDLGWSSLPGADRWHHLVYTYDGSIIRIYADGALDNEEAVEEGMIETSDGFPIVIGAQNLQGGGWGFHATLALARVRVHSGVLSAAEVASNFDLERGEF